MLKQAKSRAADVVRRLFPDLMLTAEGPQQVDRLGHRAYIGGDWDVAGAAMQSFLQSRGMTPQSVLLDIACGSFRLGTHAIPFLDRGNYLGLEKEAALVEAGFDNELGRALVEEKAPEIVISENFEFDRFSKQADFAIASSLFTHLTPALVDLCLTRLRPALRPGAPFFATFRPRPRFWRNPSVSNAFASFRYTREEMIRFGERNGYDGSYIGEWRPNGVQMMMCYRVRDN